MVRALLVLSLLTATAAAAAPAGKTPLQKEPHALGLALPAPNDFCELSPSQPADRYMLETAEQMNAGHNRVLAIFADCGQLAAMRGKGAVLNDYAMYMIPLSAADLPPTMTRAEFIELVAGTLGEPDTVEKAEDIVQNRLSEANAAIELQDLVSLGPLHRDDVALYTGVLARTAEAGAEVEVTAVVVGVTMIDGQVVTLNLSAPYEGQRTIDALLAEQRDNVQRLIDAN